MIRTGTQFDFFSQRRKSSDPWIMEASLEESIRQSIIILLSTEKSERPLFPEYGSYLSRFIFRRNDDSVLSKISDHVFETVEMFEKRVRVDSVRTLRRENESSYLDIDLRYTIEKTGAKQSLKFPLRLVS